MKTFLFSFFIISFCVVSFCTESVDFKENEVNIDTAYSMKKADKLYKDKKLASRLNPDMTERQRLINHILSEDYDIRNYPTNMTIRFGVSIIKIDIDEAKNSLEVDGWIKMTWTDKRLEWNNKEFNVDTLRMKVGEIWRPDVTLYNSATLYEMLKCTETNALIYPSGEVLWVPPCHFSASCNLTLDTDPYGPQTCILKFGSWTFDALSMDLQIYNDETKADITNLWDTTRWSLISNDVSREVKYYECCPEPYVSITYTLTVQRKSSPHKIVSGDS